MRRSLGATQLTLDNVRRATCDLRLALGGYAQPPKTDLERDFRQATFAMVGGGTNEIQYSFMVRKMGL